MQPITLDLLDLLKAKFQAGASGFRGKVICEGVTHYPTSMNFDKSLGSPAALFSATFTNENGEVGLAEDAFPDNALFTAHAWYGDAANAVQIFEGFIDKISETRDPKTVTITCRDWAKILIEQDMATIAPQGADEDGTDRTTANLVYLNMEISDIVNDLLTKAGWPAAKRLIQPTNFVVDEYLGRDGSKYIDAIGELADVVAYNAFAEEHGFYRFQADGKVDTVMDTDTPPVPVYTFRTGEDITSITPTRDDYETYTRVKVTGPLTTLQDAWTELWHTNVIVNPTGVRYEPGDPDHLYVADGPLRKIYKITQGSDAAIVSSVNLSASHTYLNGLSGDPSDSAVYWTLDTPWILGLAATNNKLRKIRKSDNAILATFTLANQLWTDMKVGTGNIWATNWSTGKVHKLSKVDGSEVANYAVAGHTQPIGVAIDGTDLFLAFYAEATLLQVTTADPTTIIRTLAFSGTKSLGGDIDTDTHTELYACSGGLSLVYKYTLREPVTNDVSIEAVNADLEAALGVELDTGVQIRRLRRDLKLVTSYAQAAEAAARWLDRVDQFRNVMDFGIIGNPALQLGDMVRVEDPVTGIANDFEIDTYRFQMDDTCLGTLAVKPWTSSYAGPGDVAPNLLIYTSTAWKDWRVSWHGGALGGTPANWADWDFDDSGWDTPVSVGGGVDTVLAAVPPGENITPAEAYSSTTLRGLVWLSRSPAFNLTVLPTSATVYIAQDDDSEFYINGVLAFTSPYSDRDHFIPHTIDPSLFRIGDNVLAIKTTNLDTYNTWGPPTDNPTYVEARLFGLFGA